MPWCPKCKNEYREGIIECSDCHTPLTEELGEVNADSTLVPIIFGEEEEINRLKAFLEFSQITSSVVSFDEKDNTYELKVPSKDAEKVKKITAIFLKQEDVRRQEAESSAQAEESPIFNNEEEAGTGILKSNIEETAKPDDELLLANTYEEDHEPESAGSYVKNADKASDFKSSAYTLLLVGIGGIIALGLVIAGIIPLELSANVKYITYVTMGFLFIMFIIIGISSMKSAKKFEKAAVVEEEKTNEIVSWFTKNYTAENIDAMIPAEDGEVLSEEQKYFKRYDKIKDLIKNMFQDTNLAMVEKLTEDLYAIIFEQ